ncbi:flagellar brake domain-containing protein [Psychromonas antarctica]|uniref:flagellar brake domain-containing protein n=1 Tax=Psychromonas antarctica TaxID=67573 RepID=UPI001EE7C73F|nr:flagellar brake protein [Psychromonas antarctica]
MANPLLDEYAHLNKIACETEVYLQIITPVQAIRLKTRLIGVDPNMSIILAMGSDQEWLSAKESILEGKKLIVRLVNSEQPEAYIIAFQTQVQKLMSIAGRWLVLDYPKSIQRVALRLHSRLPTYIDAMILDQETKKACCKGVLTDISINGGAFIGGPISGQVIDKKFILQVSLANEEGAQKIPVIVKNSKILSGHNQLVQYGLNIASTTEKSKSFVEHLVLHSLFNQVTTAK